MDFTSNWKLYGCSEISQASSQHCFWDISQVYGQCDYFITQSCCFEGHWDLTMKRSFNQMIWERKISVSRWLPYRCNRGLKIVESHICWQPGPPLPTKTYIHARTFFRKRGIFSKGGANSKKLIFQLKIRILKNGTNFACICPLSSGFSYM